MQRIYLDSNIFIAYIRSDMGKPFKLMFKDVEDFFDCCPNRFVLVLSEFFIEEVEKKVHYSKSMVGEFFKDYKISTEFIETTKIEKKLAPEFFKKGLHAGDALHAAFAINSKCDFLLTFNIKDFKRLENRIKLREPKELVE
ncbi:MAG: PIN domain-containing protein [Candidatus Diapherotrites archaeon]